MEQRGLTKKFGKLRTQRELARKGNDNLHLAIRGHLFSLESDAVQESYITLTSVFDRSHALNASIAIIEGISLFVDNSIWTCLRHKCYGSMFQKIGLDRKVPSSLEDMNEGTFHASK